jgi:hypothetical protein
MDQLFDAVFPPPKDRSMTGTSISKLVFSTKPNEPGEGSKGLHFRAALFLTLEGDKNDKKVSFHTKKDRSITSQ